MGGPAAPAVSMPCSMTERALDSRCGENDGREGGARGLWIPAAARMTVGVGDPLLEKLRKTLFLVGIGWADVGAYCGLRLGLVGNMVESGIGRDPMAILT